MRLRYIFILLLITYSCFAQDNNFYQAKQIISPQNFTLNSVSRTFIGGNNATEININLPRNTVKWYYKFETFKIDQKSPETTLLAELAGAINKGTKLAVQFITQPTGVNVCNVSLYENGVFSTNGSRKMFAAGVVEVIPKSYYNKIVMENTSGFEGLKIQLEVVAIIHDVEKQRQAELDKSVEDLSYAIADLVEISQASKAKKLKKDKSEMNTYLNLGFKKLKNGAYQSAINIFKEATNLKNTFRYKAYQGLATTYRYAESYNLAIETYQKAIKVAKKDNKFKASCYGGLGLTYLLLSNELEANKCYIKLINLDKAERAGAIQAIKIAIERQGKIEGSSDIIELLSE